MRISRALAGAISVFLILFHIGLIALTWRVGRTIEKAPYKTINAHEVDDRMMREIRNLLK
jgi:hypothetical protein